MDGIPPPRTSDNEDVIWALDTAESLWKRGVRADAVVWVRRAAHEAREAGDDRRAAELLTEATALSELVGRPSGNLRSAMPTSVPPPDETNDEALRSTADLAKGDDGGDRSPATPKEPLPRPQQATLAGISQLGKDALSPLDLVSVTPLAGSSEGQRTRLVQAARVVLCASGAALPEFGLALVLEGEVLATSERDGETVARTRQGAVVRTRGTLDVAATVRFSAGVDDTTVALWTEADLATALAGGPPIDTRLRAAGDRLQAWAGVTASKLSSRLYPDVRLRLVDRLDARALRSGAELLRAGDAVSGLFLVGLGTIAVGPPLNVEVGPGSFVFPEATLSAAKAKATARAGRDGAVVLLADRRTSQELWATEPLLLELLSGS